eukprot:scaffold7257_cov65-Phaeocystis_antarctica.AAC.2
MPPRAPRGRGAALARPCSAGAARRHPRPPAACRAAARTLEGGRGHAPGETGGGAAEVRRKCGGGAREVD